MIHIIKNAKGRFDVVTLATNGKLLATTRQGFIRKADAYKNIRAQKLSFAPLVKWILIQDDTLPEPQVCFVTPTTVEIQPGLKPHKKYIPKKFKKLFLKSK